MKSAPPQKGQQPAQTCQVVTFLRGHQVNTPSHNSSEEMLTSARSADQWWWGFSNTRTSNSSASSLPACIYCSTAPNPVSRAAICDKTTRKRSASRAEALTRFSGSSDVAVVTEQAGQPLASYHKGMRGCAKIKHIPVSPKVYCYNRDSEHGPPGQACPSLSAELPQPNSRPPDSVVTEWF